MDKPYITIDFIKIVFEELDLKGIKEFSDKIKKLPDWDFNSYDNIKEIISYMKIRNYDFKITYNKSFAKSFTQKIFTRILFYLIKYQTR
jgi:hypothetical protein